MWFSTLWQHCAHREHAVILFLGLYISLEFQHLSFICDLLFVALLLVVFFGSIGGTRPQSICFLIFLQRAYTLDTAM